MAKRLVLCFDGTWNNADSQGGDTNVALISRAIHATQETGDVPQLVLYLRGVGTTGLRAERIISGATGLGVDDNIRSGYMFLAQNYLPGDEIFLFGFSRGAFTARSMVGLISAAGLLKRRFLGRLGDAWLYYRSPKPHDPNRFMAAHPGVETHADVSVAFLGVWDTVGAMGVPGRLLAPFNRELYGFHDTGVCPIVRHGCHALAIDEHRAAFVPTLWTGEAPRGSIIEQIWFAGAHADVGGGYRRRGLADIPLRWMAERAESAGLVLDRDCLPRLDALDPLAARHDSSRGVFAASRLVPTLRQICGRSFDVPFYQRRYAPTDDEGRPLPTVGEAVHESAVRRFGAEAPLCLDDAKGTEKRARWAPRNVGALMDASGALRRDTAIAPASG